MPLYEYFCQDCRTTFSLRRSFAQAGENAECPQCTGHQTKKVLNAVAVIGVGARTTLGSFADTNTSKPSNGCGCGSCNCGV